MLRAYKYRIYPNQEQKVMLEKTFGCCRFVYNWALDYRSKIYKEEKHDTSAFDLMKIINSKIKPENPWLKEVDSQALNYSIMHLNTAFQNFFKKNSKYPSFKKKHSKQSFTTYGTVCRVNFEDNTINIPKISKIKAVFHRICNGDKIHRITIIKEPDEKYYASILTNTFEPIPKKRIICPSSTIGIDMGLSSFAVCSNGEVFCSQRFYKNSEAKIKSLSKSLSRKVKGSASYCRAKIKLARSFSKLKRQRMDFIHKVTNHLTNENQVSAICIEDLNVKAMLKNRFMAKSISDASINEFFKVLSYKCEWNGINLIKIDRYIPSSKMCSNCKYVNRGLKLSTRHWTCPECGIHHDRDYNASVNIKNFGLETLRVRNTKVKRAE